MPQTRISVRLSRPGQDDLREHAEHASALPDLMTSVGLDVGRQAVIRRGVDTFALYTLTDAGADVSTDTVRMGRDGRGRLDGAEEQRFRARLDSVAVDPAATEEEARRGEKLLELFDDGDQPRTDRHRPARRRHRAVHRPPGGTPPRPAVRPGRELLAVQGMEAGWRGRHPLAHHVHRHQHRELSAPGHGRRRRVPSRGVVPRVRRGGAPRHPGRRSRAGLAQAGGAGRDRRGGRRDRSPCRDRGRRRPAGRRRGSQHRQPTHQRPASRHPDRAAAQCPVGDAPRIRTRPGWQAVAAAVADVYRVVLSS